MFTTQRHTSQKSNTKHLNFYCICIEQTIILFCFFFSFFLWHVFCWFGDAKRREFVFFPTSQMSGEYFRLDAQYLGRCSARRSYSRRHRTYLFWLELLSLSFITIVIVITYGVIFSHLLTKLLFTAATAAPPPRQLRALTPASSFWCFCVRCFGVVQRNWIFLICRHV